MLLLDRLKVAFGALARGAQPGIDYFTLYRAKVVSQRSTRRLDLRPEDNRLPPMANIPIKVGLPGLDVTVPPGAWVLVGWENGRPDRPYVTLWDAGPVSTIKLTLHATTIALGGDGLTAPLDGVVRASTPCQFTGAPHFVGGKTSLAVLAKEV
jgi:hypothetical protein